MKPYQIIVITTVIIIIMIIVFGSQAKAAIKPLISTATDYEPGKSYPDAETGGTIECYQAPQEGEPLETIFKSNTEPPLEGKLFLNTNQYACYKFPAQ